MVSLGIISDIHCHEKSDKPQGGYYFPSMSDTPLNQNPFAAAKQLFRSEKITVDYLLSPGDYAHQMDSKGLKSSWDQLKIVSNELNVKLLIGTIGNHDVASRSAGDSFGEIKVFDQDFPVYRSDDCKSHLNSLLNDSYYTIDDPEIDILFIVLNSCYDHWSAVEASKGKVKIGDLKRIQDLIRTSTRTRKILMVHHHPLIHETGISDTGDLIEGSEELLKSVAGIDLIIHGHKHDFRFTQHQIYPKNLNVLASGSFACFKTSMKTMEQNAFHIIEFHPGKVESCVNQGIIKTYLYDPASGWSLDSNLQEGFGCTLELHEIIEVLEKELMEIQDNYILWDELVEKNILFRFISRESRNKSLFNLKNAGKIKRFTIDKFNNLQGDIILR